MSLDFSSNCRPLKRQAVELKSSCTNETKTIKSLVKNQEFGRIGRLLTFVVGGTGFEPVALGV